MALLSQSFPDSQFSESIHKDPSQSSRRYGGNSDVMQQLNYAKTEQKKMLISLKSGNAKGSLGTLKKTFQSVQDTLTCVNKILLNEKKLIKKEHSQLVETDSEPDDRKMVKVARRILQQQRLLVALLKVQKQLGAKLKSIEQKTAAKQNTHAVNECFTKTSLTIPGGKASTYSPKCEVKLPRKVENTTSFDVGNDDYNDSQQTQTLIKSLMSGFSRRKENADKEFSSNNMLDLNISANSGMLSNSKAFLTSSPKPILFDDEEDSSNLSTNVESLLPKISKECSYSAVVPASPVLQLPGLASANSSKTAICTDSYVLPPIIKQETVDLTDHAVPCIPAQQSLGANSMLTVLSTSAQQSTDNHIDVNGDNMQENSDINALLIPPRLLDCGNISCEQVSSDTSSRKLPDISHFIKQLFSRELITPGQDVLRVKGSTSIASIANDGSIHSSTHRFTSLETWMCFVGKIENIDETILRKVEYDGTSLWALLGRLNDASIGKMSSQQINGESVYAASLGKKLTPTKIVRDNNHRQAHVDINSLSGQSTLPTHDILPSQSIISSQGTISSASVQPCQNNLPSQSALCGQCALPNQSEVPSQSILMNQSNLPYQSILPSQSILLSQSILPSQSVSSNQSISINQNLVNRSQPITKCVDQSHYIRDQCAKPIPHDNEMNIIDGDVSREKRVLEIVPRPPKTILHYSMDEFIDIGEILPKTFWDDGGFGGIKLDESFLQMIGLD